MREAWFSNTAKLPRTFCSKAVEALTNAPRQAPSTHAVNTHKTVQHGQCLTAAENTFWGVLVVLLVLAAGCLPALFLEEMSLQLPSASARVVVGSGECRANGTGPKDRVSRTRFHQAELVRAKYNGNRMCGAVRMN